MAIITREDCKFILTHAGIKLGVSPRLISTRLLSDEDKESMLSGELTIEALMCAIGAWMGAGMPDYAHGLTEPMK